jgi:hypothetical protein
MDRGRVMTNPIPSEVRYRVDPGDVPPEKAARRPHLAMARFNELLPKLRCHGFAGSNTTTDMFARDAIRWERSQGIMYFIRCGQSIEIGYSDDPRDRRMNLKIAALFKKTLNSQATGFQGVQHRHFAPLPPAGEWFRTRPEPGGLGK